MATHIVRSHRDLAKPYLVLSESGEVAGCVAGVYLDDKYTLGLLQKWVSEWQNAMDEASEAHGMPGQASKFEASS